MSLPMAVTVIIMMASGGEQQQHTKEHIQDIISIMFAVYIHLNYVHVVLAFGGAVGL